MEVLLFQMFKVVKCRKYCDNSSLMILDTPLPFEGRDLPEKRGKIPVLVKHNSNFAFLAAKR